MKILILGASYGSLFGTKCLMAGHDVTLVCRAQTAELINNEGTEVRIKLKTEPEHRSIFSKDLKGKLDAAPPEAIDVKAYDLVVLAMQEPQYVVHSIRTLMVKIADAGLPCLSLMNMPPLPYLKRIPGISADAIGDAYTNPAVWERFDPAAMTLCSPDPQAFRPPEEKANVLHVGLPTNFKAARFDVPEFNNRLLELERDIDAVRLDGQEVPVKLRVFDSLFVPLAKWSMLLTGNYRCVLEGGTQSIRDAVHSNVETSREIYEHVNSLVRELGGDEGDAVPFEKYAKAAENLVKPSSVARAIASGAPLVERVDRLVHLIGQSLGRERAEIAQVVATLDHELQPVKG